VDVIQYPQHGSVTGGFIDRIQQRLEQHRPVSRPRWSARF
jgi:hypothetical protein